MATGNIKHYLGCGLAADRPEALDLATGALGIYHSSDSDELWMWVENSRWESLDIGGERIPDAPIDGRTYGRKDEGWVEIPPGAKGDVSGPITSVDQRIAVFNGTSGKAIADSGLTVAGLIEQARIAPEHNRTDLNYTLVITDAFRLVAMNNIAANTLTVPPNSSVAFPVGTRIDLSQDGTGQTTVAAGVGVTIRTPETLKLRKRYGKASLIKRGPDLWDLEGNLEAAP